MFHNSCWTCSHAASLLTSTRAFQISLSAADAQWMQSLVADQKTAFSWLSIDVACAYTLSSFSRLLFLLLCCGALPCACPEGPCVWVGRLLGCRAVGVVWQRDACPEFRMLSLIYNRAREQGRVGAVDESCWVNCLWFVGIEDLNYVCYIWCSPNLSAASGQSITGICSSVEYSLANSYGTEL